MDNTKHGSLDRLLEIPSIVESWISWTTLAIIFFQWKREPLRFSLKSQEGYSSTQQLPAVGCGISLHRREKYRLMKQISKYVSELNIRIRTCVKISNT
ncbi:hypothetical protein G9A89_018627 [Geosiphon pyriformis]|nr:hypothetical protein G9A89_018627 [Geosiphon pyriformis]